MHMNEGYRYSVDIENETATQTYQGDFDELYAHLKSLRLSSPDSEGGILIGGTLQLRQANRGQLDLTYRAVSGKSVWGFDFSEISKPIKTWLALKITDTAEVERELAKISLWEYQKSLGGAGTSRYIAYKYDDTNKLTGYTKELAQKMMQGIDTYSIYTPVATCTRTSASAFTDGIASIGKYRTSLVSPTDPLPSNAGQLQAFSGLRPYWLKTGDSITGNSDGTLTRRESWTGLDKIDTDLYQLEA